MSQSRQSVVGDLLVRKLDPELKRRIAASAQRHRRSLSEEAKALLLRGLAASEAAQTSAAGLGTRLAALGREVGWTEDILPPRDDFGRPSPFAE